MVTGYKMEKKIQGHCPHFNQLLIKFPPVYRGGGKSVFSLGSKVRAAVIIRNI